MMRMIPKFSYDKHPDMFIETYKTHKLKEKKTSSQQSHPELHVPNFL